MRVRLFARCTENREIEGDRPGYATRHLFGVISWVAAETGLMLRRFVVDGHYLKIC
jgi:hypothetical protein